MYEISPKLYLEVFESLIAKIGQREFFSGRVDLTVGDTFCSLICTLVVHRGKPSEESSLRPIERLVPVWWEFRTIEGGEEILNDFSFREMLETVL